MPRAQEALGLEPANRLAAACGAPGPKNIVDTRRRRRRCGVPCVMPPWGTAGDHPPDLRQPPHRHAGDAPRAAPGVPCRLPFRMPLSSPEITPGSASPPSPCPRRGEGRPPSARGRCAGPGACSRPRAGSDPGEVDAGLVPTGVSSRSPGSPAPVYDGERFGVHFVASPRHADMLLVTGPGDPRHGRAAREKTLRSHASAQAGGGGGGLRADLRRIQRAAHAVATAGVDPRSSPVDVFVERIALPGRSPSSRVSPPTAIGRR